MALEIGNIFYTKYKIIRELGGGGFGQTYVAQDVNLSGNQQRVIKEITPSSTDSESSVFKEEEKRFYREAKALYSLGHHPQIPQLFEYFTLDNRFYLVQEFIEGHELKEELIKGKQLSQKQVIELLIEILEILKFVHSKEVIHRDIKPSNLIRRKEDQKIVLIDFGGVKEITNAETTDLNNSPKTTSVGTKNYQAPEQAYGNPRFASDIYSVGIIGIQAYTGLYPSPDQDLPKDPDTLEILWHYKRPKHNKKFARILDKMANYNVTDRYQSVIAVLDDLYKFKNPLPLKRKKLSWKKSWKLALAILLLTPILGVGARNIWKTYQANLSFIKGHDLLNSENYKEAIQAFDVAIQYESQFAEAFLGKGYALGKLKRYQESYESCQLAFTIQSNFYEALQCQGTALQGLDKYKEAVAKYDQIIEKSEENTKLDQYLMAEVWFNKGESLLEIEETKPKKDRKYDNTLDSFENAIAIIKFAENEGAVKEDQKTKMENIHLRSLTNTGKTFLFSEEYCEANRALDKALNIDPDDSLSQQLKDKTNRKLQELKRECSYQENSEI